MKSADDLDSGDQVHGIHEMNPDDLPRAARNAADLRDRKA